MPQSNQPKTRLAASVAIGVVAVAALAFSLFRTDQEDSRRLQPGSVTSPAVIDTVDEMPREQSSESRNSVVGRTDESHREVRGQFVTEPEMGTAEFLSARDEADRVLAQQDRILRSRLVALDVEAVERFVRAAIDDAADIRFTMPFFEDIECTIDSVRRVTESQTHATLFIRSGCNEFRDLRISFDPKTYKFTANLNISDATYTAVSINKNYAIVIQTEPEHNVEDF